VRLSRRRLLLLLDNLLITETEPSYRRLPGAAGECNSSVPKNAFTIQIEIRIQKRSLTKSGSQSRGLLCSSIQELATNKEAKNKAPKAVLRL
jgi:hypothetical protein